MKQSSIFPKYFYYKEETYNWKHYDQHQAKYFMLQANDDLLWE